MTTGSPSERASGSEILVVTDDEVHTLLEVDALLDELRVALAALSNGQASVPPRITAKTPSVMLTAMPGYVPGEGLGAKLVSVAPGNTKHGRPAAQGVLVVFHETTGEPLALINGRRVTAIRTAATSALSTVALARPDASVLAVIGAGVQAAAHLDIFCRVFSILEARIASRTLSNAQKLASATGVTNTRTVNTIEEAVRGADIVCCCTDSSQPVLRYDWLQPGAHLVSVGMGGAGPELDEETMQRSSVFVETRDNLDKPYPTGAHEFAFLVPTQVTELGEVVARAHPGRRSPSEITVFKSTGHAVEDVAALSVIYQRARDRGIGTLVAF